MRQRTATTLLQTRQINMTTMQWKRNRQELFWTNCCILVDILAWGRCFYGCVVSAGWIRMTGAPNSEHLSSMWHYNNFSFFSILQTGVGQRRRYRCPIGRFRWATRMWRGAKPPALRWHQPELPPGRVLRHTGPSGRHTARNTISQHFTTLAAHRSERADQRHHLGHHWDAGASGHIAGESRGLDAAVACAERAEIHMSALSSRRCGQHQSQSQAIVGADQCKRSRTSTTPAGSTAAVWWSGGRWRTRSATTATHANVFESGYIVFSATGATSCS